MVGGGLLLLAACETLPASAQIPQPTAPASVEQPSAAAQQAGLPPTDASLLGSLPIPPGAKIITDQSLIIGSGDTWVGRLSLDVGRDVTGAYQYFLDAFRAQGWTLQSAVRSKNSLLVFTRAGRSATIEFQDTPKLVGGTLVTLTMAPLGSISRY
jgi:hypothetical protein